MKRQRGHCTGKFPRHGGGVEKDGKGGLFVPASVGLNTGICGPMARYKFYTCPVRVADHSKDPIRAYAFKAYRRWKTFGLQIVPNSPKLLDALECISDELQELRKAELGRESV